MKKIGLVAAFLGLAGVALGAFGAHALEARLAATDTTGVWETAVFYHLLHAVGLFALALFADGSRGEPSAHRLLVAAGICWAAGVVAFSGSLYLLALGGARWVGPVTPFGGAALIAGWAVAGVALWRRGQLG